MKGKEIKIGEGKKTFHLVMGTWNNKSATSLKKKIIWMTKKGRRRRVGITSIRVAREKVWVGRRDC